MILLTYIMIINNFIICFALLYILTNLGHAVCRSETYASMPPEGIVINAIGMSVVAVAIVVLYTVRGTGGYRLRKVAQNPS